MLGQRDSERSGAHDAKLGSSNLSHIRHRPETIAALMRGKARLDNRATQAVLPANAR